MKHLLLTLSLFLCFNVEAQTKATIDLKATYGLSEVQSKLQLSNLGTIAVTSAKFPRAYARCTGLGWSDAKFQTLSCFDAAWMDAVYQGQGGGQPITGTLNSQNHVIVPAGAYYQTVPAEFSGGEYIGQGSGYTDVGNASVNTALVLWHEQWQGDPAERHCLQSGSWGVTGSSAGYQESTIIRGFRLEGRSKEFAHLKFNSTGIRNWKPGECSYTSDVYARNFRTYGILMYAPTPHDIGTVSVFDNVQGGIGCIGCWGGSINIGVVSGDDNGAMIESVPYINGGDTTEGGGTWNIDLVKLETCVATGGNPPTRVYRGQAAANMEGQFAMNIGAISAASSFCDVDALFVTKNTLTTGDVQSSYIKVGAMKGFNFSTLLHDRTNLKRWGYTDYVGLGFEWTSRAGGILTTVPAIASSAACSKRIDFLRSSGTPSHTTCTPYRYIIDGPPRSATTTYLDATVTPPPTPCTYTYSAWGACVNGTETRTVVSATPTGCTGTPVLSQTCTVAPGTWTCTSWGAWSTCSNSTQTRVRTCTCTGGTCVDPKPAESESQACTVTPPPTGSAIDPNDVLVVWNSSDARTQAWATSYATAWGIPPENIIAVNAGTSHDASTTTATAIRTAIQAKVKQYTVLAWEYPSRVGSQSITSLVTFGPRNVSSLTVSPLYNYTGTKPRTDKGVAPSALLVSDKYIRKDADGTRPQGQAILLLANDATGAPRGIARKGQTATGVTVWDNTVPIKRPGKPDFTMGKGLNSCNFISTLCFLDVRTPSTVPILAAYQSMYELGDAGAVVWAKGFYADHVTSVGGYLPGGAAPNYLNSQGQTALTYHLAKGASMSVGSVSEPWQGSDGSLAKQFVNVSIFHPLFLSGKPVGVAAWASVQCPDRALMAGDLLSAPFR